MLSCHELAGMDTRGRLKRERKKRLGHCYGQMFPVCSLPCREKMDSNEKSWTADSTLLCCFGLLLWQLNYMKRSVIYSLRDSIVIAKRIFQQRTIENKSAIVCLSLIHDGELERSM